MSPFLAGVLEWEALPYVSLLVKATALLAFAGAASFALRGGAPAVRHLVWTLTAAALLVLPLASWALPVWGVPLVSEAPSSRATSVEAPILASPAAGSGGPTVPAVEVAAVDRGSPTGEGVSRAMHWRRATSPAGLLFLWGAGSGVVLVWMLGGRVALHFVRRRATPLGDPEWDRVRRDCAWLLEVDRPVALYRSRSATMPVTWGVVRPMVVLPEGADSWPEDRRRAVLLHELSHVARSDCLTQLLAGLACALYWFHPGVWYAARRMRVERERACDERVLSAGTSGPAYAAHLLDLARHCRATIRAPLVALHMARPSQLEGRLLAVLAGSPDRRTPTRLGIAAATAAAMVLTLPLSALQPAVADVTADAPSAMEERAEPSLAASAVLSAPGPPHPSPAPAVADTPPPQAAGGRPRDAVQVSTEADSVARVVPRVPVSDAAFGIITQSGHAALLLRDSTIVVQLTDLGLEEIGRGDAREDEDRDFLALLLDRMLRTGLRMLLDHAIEYSVADLREARYEEGRLVLESRKGGDVFRNLEVNGRDVMADFHPRDARAFVARVNAARPRR
jgi:beta-lactamase regulating signal transducer with metallopeptidase domain